jgi:hypothetical protein
LTRYFFDIVDGERYQPDLEGLVFAEASEAQRAAVEGMADLVRETLIQGSNRKLAMHVRSGSGEPVLECVVSMNVTLLSRGIIH